MNQKRKVIIVGGGFAGLTSAIVLSRYRNMDIELWDKRNHFINSLKLHKTIYTPIKKFKYNYSSIAKQFGFTFRNIDLHFNQLDLERWNRTGTIQLNSEQSVYFDYVLICTGGEERNFETEYSVDWEKVIPLSRIKNSNWNQSVLHQIISRKIKDISFVGAGATGLQFLFEMSDLLKSKKIKATIRLVHERDSILEYLHEDIQKYVIQKIYREKILYYSGVKYLGSYNNRLYTQNPKNLNIQSIPTDITFLFNGVRAFPFLLNTNRFGQLKRTEEDSYDNLFAAGDCSLFEGSGLNSLSAQAAVRKGKAIAYNIIQLERGDKLIEYDYKELGYFMNLGFQDAIGWLLDKSQVVAGLPAYLLKESIDLRTELLLQGVDTF